MNEQPSRHFPFPSMSCMGWERPTPTPEDVARAHSRPAPVTVMKTERRIFLSGKLSQLEKKLGPQGRLGVSGVLLDPSCAVKTRIDHRSDEAFPMASVVKVPIAMAASFSNWHVPTHGSAWCKRRCAPAGPDHGGYPGDYRLPECPSPAWRTRPGASVASPTMSAWSPSPRA